MYDGQRASKQVAIALASLPYVTDVRAGFFYMCCVFVKNTTLNVQCTSLNKKSKDVKIAIFDLFFSQLHNLWVNCVLYN